MRLGLVSFFLVVASALALSAAAFSGGPPADTVKSNDGCTCHGSANPNTVIHVVKGWPATYVPNQQYILEVSSKNDVQPKPGLEQSQGGFLAWVSKGEFTTTPGTQSWIDVGLMSSGEHWVRHNIQGEKENGLQVWNFTWTAPAAGSGDVNLHVYVNRINSNGQTSGDHWNKRTFSSKEGAGTPTSVFPTPSHTNPNTATTTRSPTTGDTTPRTDGGGGSPGIGFVASAALVVLVGLGAHRRRRAM